jgi:hypothetical protein
MEGFRANGRKRPWLTVIVRRKMKYDDASWHYGGDFPSDVLREAGGTHIGMFVAWCLLNGLGGDIHTKELPDILDRLRKREQTPGNWFLGACDEKFTNEDLSEEGNEFARAYYEMRAGGYVDDYTAAVGEGYPTLYHVPDTWDTYEKLSPVLGRRFKGWKNPRKWWQIWK